MSSRAVCPETKDACIEGCLPAGCRRQAALVPQDGEDQVALTNDELNALTKERFGNMHSQYAEGFRRLLRNAIEANDKKRRAALASNKAAAVAVPADSKLLPPKLTAAMREAAVKAARDYMERTGGNSPEAIYEAAWSAAAVAVGEPKGWKLVPIDLTDRMRDEADFAMQSHAGDDYSESDSFDGWFQPVWSAILKGTPPAPIASSSEAAAVAVGESEPRTYTTTPGESVMGIALRQCGNEEEWRHILACNPKFADLLPSDYFPVGTVLTLPRPPAPIASAEEAVPTAADILANQMQFGADMAAKYSRVCRELAALKAVAPDEESVKRALATYNSEYCLQRTAGTGGGEAELIAMTKVLATHPAAAQPSTAEVLELLREVASRKRHNPNAGYGKTFGTLTLNMPIELLDRIDAALKDKP